MRVPDPEEFFQNLEYDTERMQLEGCSTEAISVMRGRRLRRFLGQVDYYERLSGRSLGVSFGSE